VILWRISQYHELDGIGGLRAPGRWHKQGSRIVYCAPNPSAALLEVLVHIRIDIGDLPDPLDYLEIDVPDTLAAESVDAAALGRSWQTNDEATQRAGDAWLRSMRTALLRVPSVITPGTWNVLINPRHSESAEVRIIGIHRHSIDRRLV